MDSLLRDFLTESAENLAQLDLDMVELERRPADLQLINSIFRTIHTLKGTCGFIGLPRLESVAHKAESVLVKLRDGAISVQPALVTDVLAAVDVFKEILAELERSETEPVGDDSDLLRRLSSWVDGMESAEVGREDLERAINAAMTDDGIDPNVFGLFDEEEPAAPQAAEAVVQKTDTVSAPDARKSADAPERAEGGKSSGGVEATLRVNVNLLDRLMNMVGELVLTRNQLTQLVAAEEESAYATPIQQLNRVATDLQEAVTKTRMQPIGTAWTKLPRLVRDLATASGKEIDLDLHGAETEIDRQVLQAIQDPMIHMIRNAADHGVESVEKRRAKGKVGRGTIKVSAFHEGGHVILQIDDDGAGIDVERVRQKAVERGLVKAEVAATLSDQQVFRFIFEPGFSTAEQVTNVSGRGVGMDVVRTNIEKIGGAVELSSRFGYGTTVRIKIPLTLAIVPALLVGLAGDMFAIPQVGIVELVRVTGEQGSRVEEIHGALFFRLRETLLPLIPLASVLSLNERREAAEYNIVVCQVGKARLGIVVDEVFDTQEIVVKPVGRMVKHLAFYAGCTILGDGRVIMILDPTGVAKAAMDLQSSEQGSDSAISDRDGALGDSGQAQSLVLFDAAQHSVQAVPLAKVARLEEIPQSQIEEAGGRFLVQYRGALLPIVAASSTIDIRAKDPRPVIVFSDHGRAMGLAVESIRDIVEERFTLDHATSSSGVLGVGVIAGKATEVIDTNYFLQHALGTAGAAVEEAA